LTEQPTAPPADPVVPPEVDDVFGPLARVGLDPLAWLGQRRDEGPIARLDLFGNPVWLVTRYAEVKAVLADSSSFSNDLTLLGIGEGDGGGDPALVNPGGLGFMDPPDHTRLRRVLTPAFAPRRLVGLLPSIMAVIDGRLDALVDRGHGADLVAMFAEPVPAMVIGALLGVSGTEQEEFGQLVTDRFDLLNSLGAPLESMQNSADYLQALVARHRQAPGAGLLGDLLRHLGPDTDDRTIAGIVDGLLVGGHETTASMIALSALMLTRDQDLADRVRTRPASVPAIVEELLRYLSVVQVAFPRFARRDMDLAGHAIAAGDIVLCSLLSANRDDRSRPNPHSMQTTGQPGAHLAFGYGVHHCLGAQLARMELQLVLPALVQRFPGLQVAVPEEQLRFRQRSIVYGLHELPVRW
jgi:cytochrome P450